MIGRAIDSVKAVADTAMVGQHKVMVECLANSASVEKADSKLCHWLGQLVNPDGANVWWESWNFCFFAGLVVFILLCVVFRSTWKRVVDFLSHHLLIASLIVLIAGFWVYTWGYYNPELGWYSVIPRSVISSFKMFVVMHDLARVDKELFTNDFYMACFSLTHFAAALLTFLMIFKLVGFRLFSIIRLKILQWRFRFCSKAPIHVFWGINEESLLLAESIKARGEKDSAIKDDRIIFVSIVKDSADMPRQKATLASVIDVVTLRNSELERLDKIDALVDNCHNGPSSVQPSENREDESPTDVFGSLRLRVLRKIVARAEAVNFYLLSDDEEQNVSGALNLQNDNTVTSRDKVKIYVHARKTINAELFDTYAQYVEHDDKKPSVKLVDSAYKSVKKLKETDVEETDGCLPVDCVDYDKKTGLVSSPFTSLIVGFNATGQEAFKFLYEHGTFIGPNKEKLPFKCYAVDQNMTAIEGIITSKVGYVIDSKELELINAEVNSKVFWDKVELIINDLNYAVIALNNDELGLQLAVNLFKLALRKRDNKLPLKIALRCYDSHNIRMMHKVEKNLNESIKVKDSEKDSGKDSGIHVSLTVFGDQSKIFDYESVLSDAALVKAKRYNWVYEQTTPLYDKEKEEMDEDEQWKLSFGADAVKSTLEKPESHGSLYHAKYEMLCKIEQNFANVAHAKTKLQLMGLDKEHQKLNDLLKVIENRDPGKTDYKCDKAEYAELLHNMALLEHERFISARRLKGFEYGSPKDFVKKHHDCLCPLEMLDELTQSYDCNVIDTTLRLKAEEPQKKSSEGDRNG
ncbi:MAG: hypothetical protein IKU16_07425 [Muribaculaceae bacterium]|nr:hypothetical protein [Muribaculaceae bacterium]